MDLQAFYQLYQQCNKVTIDSRTVGKGDLFFAFSGENFNAATLAEEAINNGALAVIVEQKIYENRAKNIFYQPSTLMLLQDLAKYHRSKLSIPVIGLTGSNGKTTTKELMAKILMKKYHTQFTQGNLNNHIGVPLTLLSIQSQHEIAIIEMGANHQKEIEFLCEMAQPDIGYITNFGKAHLEGFGGFGGVIKGKSELYQYLISNGKKILVNEQDEIQKEKTQDYPKIISFGKSASDYHFEDLSENNLVGISYDNQAAISNLTGNYNFTNLCAAASMGLYFNIGFTEIKSAIEAYHPTNMRSQILKKNGKTLVLDTYNANPSSMAVSLYNFKNFRGTKAVIIGDMLELGEEKYTEHLNIINIAQSLGFDEIYTVGKIFAEVNSDNTFLSSTELIEFLKNHSINCDNILLKGSRGIALEKIINFL